jgi:hypothetical protein
MRTGRFLLAAALAFAGAAAAEEDALLFEPAFREGQPADVLVAGDPPLRREHVDAFVEFAEASFEISFPARREQDLRDAIETGFEASGKERREGLLAAVRPWSLVKERAARGDHEAVRDAFATFRREVDLRLQDLPRARAGAILGEVLGSRREVLWPGTPPVNANAAGAYLEVAQLVVSLGRNEDAIPTEGQVATLREELKAALHGQPTAVRARIAAAHRLWSATKARWVKAGEADRFRMRWEAVELGARLLPPGRARVVARGPTMADYAREALAVALAQPSYDAFANAARNPQALFEALEKGLGLPKEIDHPVHPCR